MLTKIQTSQLADSIAMVIILLMALGTVFIFSADVNLSQKHDLQQFYNLPSLRQLIFFPLAVLVLYTHLWFEPHTGLLKQEIERANIEVYGISFPVVMDSTIELVEFRGGGE